MNIQSLSTPEKILLAEKLWDSVHTKSTEVDLATKQKEILDSRLECIERDGEPGDTWQQVKARVIQG